MSNRTLVTYEEERNDDGPYWRLEIQRSAAGRPGLLFTISFDSFDGTMPHREMTIVVNDGSDLLIPVNAWLNDTPGFAIPPNSEERARTRAALTEIVTINREAGLYDDDF